MAQKASEPSRIFVQDFLGGLNTRTYNTRVQDNQVSGDTINTRMTEDGVIGKRLGVNYYGTIGSLASTSYIGGLGVYYYNNVKELFADAGPWLLKYTSGRFTPISGATFTLNHDKNFVTARGELYIHNGVDMMTKYTGSALTRLTGAATAASAVTALVAAGGVVGKFGIFFKTSQLVSGNPINQNRVYVSQAGNSGNFLISNNNQDANSTDQSQWYDVAKDDGDIVVGMTTASDSTIIFKDRAFYEAKFNTSITASSGTATGTTNFFSTILPMNKGVGAVSHRVIDNIENDTVFLSRTGPTIYLLGQQANLTGLRLAEISQPVRNLLEGIAPSALERCAVMYFNKRLYVSIPYGSTSTNNRILVFNREYGVWEGFYTGLSANCFTTFIDPVDSTEKLMMADEEAVRVGQMEMTSYTDFSNAINCDTYFKSFDAGAPARFKRWQDVTLFFRNTVGDVTVNVYVDDILRKTKTFAVGVPTHSVGLGAGVVGLNLLGDAGGGDDSVQETTVDKRMKINFKGRKCQIRVINNVAGERFNLISLELSYRASYGYGSYPSSNKVR